MADRPLTLEEQVFVNAMGYLALCFNDYDNTKMMLETVRELLPQVDYEHERVGLLAECADAMLNSKMRATPEGRRNAYAAAMASARTHLARIFFHRAAVGWDQINTTLVEAS